MNSGSGLGRMTTCVFCHELGTTTTNPPDEAFPFLCSQLGDNSVTLGLDSGSEVVFCGSCRFLFEEVTLLYSTMQGINNLMGRKVGQIKQKLRITQDNCNPTNHRNKDKGKKMGVTPRSNDPVDESSMMNCWYPPSTNDDQGQEEVELRGGGRVEVKTEPLDFESGPGAEIDGEYELMEEIEINPEEDKSEYDVDEVSDEDDPEFKVEQDPLYVPPTHPSASLSRRKPLSKQRQRGPRSRIPKYAVDADPPAALRGIRPDPRLKNVPYELLPTTGKNRYVLFMADYIYYVNKKGLGKKIWRCEMQNRPGAGKIKCPARIHTTHSESDPSEFAFIAIHDQHSHDPDYVHIQKLRDRSSKIKYNKMPKKAKINLSQSVLALESQD